ncbi:MAG: hypothetical protein H0T40_14270 [Geodermatophilaceae bacterium]|nr:hypothetical protein [Geodermatophilaceae bacterium]
MSVHPIFNLYNRRWPIFTNPPQLPPAKFVQGGSAGDSIVGAGVIISGGKVSGSVISPGCRLASGCDVVDSVLMDNVTVGAGAVIRRAILDKNVVVAPGAKIGVDPVRDAERYHMSPGGVVVLGKGAVALAD